jgi:hypothetical protein
MVHLSYYFGKKVSEKLEKTSWGRKLKIFLLMWGFIWVISLLFLSLFYPH